MDRTKKRKVGRGDNLPLVGGPAAIVAAEQVAIHYALLARTAHRGDWHFRQ